MHELGNHLWQSTVFAAAIALAAWVLGRHQAKLRHALWLAASMKFLLPFSLLVSLGAQLEVPAVRPAIPVAAVEQITTTFAPIIVDPQPQAPLWPAAIWLIGATVCSTRWFLGWRAIHKASVSATSLPIAAPIPVLSAETTTEPGVFGFFEPVLLLPAGILQKLSPAELHAVLAHELAHVKRHDNLTAALHMLVETIFWFHPLVWFIGAKLVEERERACDEAVLTAGNHPQIYAQGILNVCKFYLESPLPCAAGVTGSDLKKRIEEIMTQRTSRPLTFGRKLVLAAAGFATLATPIAIGLLNAPLTRAQSKADPLSFEVATIKPSDPSSNQVRVMMTPGGGINITNMGLKNLIAFAYGIPCGRNCDAQIQGGPAWANTQRFDVVAKSARGENENDGPGNLSEAERATRMDQMRQRMQSLLAERFQLMLKKETKELAVYTLVVGKGGPKMKESEAGEASGPQRQMMRAGRGLLNAEGITMDGLAQQLAGQLGRPVTNKTGLTKTYNFELKYAPENASGEGSDGPSLFTAVQEQLGLKLDSTKAPVEILNIERAEKPSAN